MTTTIIPRVTRFAPKDGTTVKNDLSVHLWLRLDDLAWYVQRPTFVVWSKGIELAKNRRDGKPVLDVMRVVDQELWLFKEVDKERNYTEKVTWDSAHKSTGKPFKWVWLDQGLIYVPRGFAEDIIRESGDLTRKVTVG